MEENEQKNKAKSYYENLKIIITNSTVKFYTYLNELISMLYILLYFLKYKLCIFINIDYWLNNYTDKYLLISKI